MHEPEFDEIFGCDSSAVKAAIGSDEEGWLESDYQEALFVLRNLRSDNPEQFEDFLGRFHAVEGLEKFSFQERCQLIYFLLSSYIDWRATKATRIRTENFSATMLFEKVYKSDPPIRLDFQNVVDQLANFNPTPEQARQWAQIFSPNSEYSVPPEEEFPGIAPELGTKQKRGRKPRS